MSKTAAGKPPLAQDDVQRRAVTISRQTGSGGHVVAEQLAAYLQAHAPNEACPWTVFDRNLVEKVLDALRHAPLEACGVREVKGYGRQKSYLDEYRGSEYSLAFLPKVEITLWVDDLRVEEVIRTIVEAARTGRQGDGKIFVLPAGITSQWTEDF